MPRMYRTLPYIKTKAKGSFVIGHRNTSNTDVTYDYIIVG